MKRVTDLSSPAVEPIFGIAQRAGLQLRGSGSKRQLCCPFHTDQHPSAFVSENNVFFCSVCTPDRGWTAQKFARMLGMNRPSNAVPSFFPPRTSSDPRQRLRSPQKKQPLFSHSDATSVWDAALNRTRNDEAVDADQQTYNYLQLRGLIESWDHSAFGVLTGGMTLPQLISHWPRKGFRIIVPLYDLSGELVNIQGRRIFESKLKVLFPKGSCIRGNVFATQDGVTILRDPKANRSPVVLGEGLTDHLALTITSPVPVLSAPGTSIVPECIGPWVAGRELWIGLDQDDAGCAVVDAVAKAAFLAGATRVRRIEWPDGCADACDVLAAIGVEGLTSFLDDGHRGVRR